MRELSSYGLRSIVACESNILERISHQQLQGALYFVDGTNIEVRNFTNRISVHGFYLKTGRTKIFSEIIEVGNKKADTHMKPRLEKSYLILFGKK